MKKLKNLKKTTKVDFATYIGVIAAFVIVLVCQRMGLLSRSISGMLVPIWLVFKCSSTRLCHSFHWSSIWR